MWSISTSVFLPLASHRIERLASLLPHLLLPLWAQVIAQRKNANTGPETTSLPFGQSQVSDRSLVERIHSAVRAMTLGCPGFPRNRCATRCSIPKVRYHTRARW